MKRVRHYLTEQIERCVMYREDIEGLVALLEEGGNTVIIYSGDLQAENVADLCEYLGADGKQDLKFDGIAPNAVLVSSLDSGGLLITGSNSDDSGVARFHRVVEAARSCRIRSYRSMRLTVESCVFMVGGWLGAASLMGNPTSIRTALGVVGIVAVALTLLSTAVVPRGRSRFYGVRRNERKTFFKRNGDALIVGLTLAIVGACLGVVGTLLTQRIGK